MPVLVQPTFARDVGDEAPAGDPREGARGRETGGNGGTKNRGGRRREGRWEPREGERRATAPPEEKGTETISIATWNIRDGRNGGLYSAARALDEFSNIDIAVVQETKFTEEEIMYAPKCYRGYRIRTAPRCTDSPSGGVSLLYREDKRKTPYRVENDRAAAPNIITFELVTGDKERWFVVGCYIPPCERGEGGGETTKKVEQMIKDRPKDTLPLVLGDLNANLEYPRGRQEEVMSSGMKAVGIGCATRHFLTRRTRHAKGPWTWVQRRTDSVGQRRRITQKLDYALIGDEIRRKVRRCRLVQVPGHDTDHRAIVLKVTTNGEAVRRYRHKAETFPLTLPIGPRTEGEAMFEELQLLQPMVPVRERHTHDWIREGTWIIVDRRAALRKQNKLPRAEGRALTRKIHASLKLDRIERARRAGEELMKEIGSGCIRDA